jgi:hypothetical protein
MWREIKITMQSGMEMKRHARPQRLHACLRGGDGWPMYALYRSFERSVIMFDTKAAKLCGRPFVAAEYLRLSEWQEQQRTKLKVTQ